MEAESASGSVSARQPEGRHSDPAAHCGRAHTHPPRHRRRSCEQAATPRRPWPGRAGQGREGGGGGGGGATYRPRSVSSLLMRLRAMVWCGVVCLVVVVVVVLWLMCRAESWAEQDVKASGVAVAVAAARTWYRTSWAICSGRNHQYRLYLFLLHHVPHRRHAGQAKFTGISNPTT